MSKFVTISVYLVFIIAFIGSIGAWIPELIENWDKGSVALRTLPILAIALSLIGIIVGLSFVVRDLKK